MSRETFRRTLKGRGPVSLKAPTPKKHEGEILHVANSRPVVTITSTTPIYDAVQIMVKKGFRRVPVADPGTKTLEGIVTAVDIIDYLGGGKRFEIIQQKYDGNFFKAINQPIKIIMTKNIISVQVTARVSEAIELMKENNVGGLPVVDNENHVKAIITERDIVNLFVNLISGVKVSQLMSENVVTALPKTTIFEAEKTMVTRGFRRLPIISDDKIIGMITAMDIIRFFGLGHVFKHLQSGTILQVLNTSALEVATKEITTIEPHADISQAARKMQDRNIGAVPVAENQKLVGIITERDFFKIIA